MLVARRDQLDWAPGLEKAVANMFVLVAHFRLTSEAGVSVAEPLALLAASPQCRWLRFARSTNAAERFVLLAEFDSAAEYRRSLAPWPMRTVVVPWLSTADQDLSEVSEVLFSSTDGVVVVTEPTVPEPGR